MKILLIRSLALLLCTNLSIGCATSGAPRLRESTYIFWAPSSKKVFDVDKGLLRLNSRLNTKCGGFSRWAIDGGWRDSASNRDVDLPGYFYLISCNELRASDLASMIREEFNSK